MKYENIPYRVWRKHRFGMTALVVQPVARRVLRHMGDAMKRGAVVTMENHIANRRAIIGQPYDTLTVTIQD